MRGINAKRLSSKAAHKRSQEGAESPIMRLTENKKRNRLSAGKLIKRKRNRTSLRKLEVFL